MSENMLDKIINLNIYVYTFEKVMEFIKKYNMFETDFIFTYIYIIYMYIYLKEIWNLSKNIVSFKNHLILIFLQKVLKSIQNLSKNIIWLETDLICTHNIYIFVKMKEIFGKRFSERDLELI